MRTLYHYCCGCSARQITARGFLRPHGAALFGQALIWLTDMAEPNREALGLTSKILQCDRLEYQYIVNVSSEVVMPWLESPIRLRCSYEMDPDFENRTLGRMPERWYVATAPLYAVRNRRYIQPAASKLSRLSILERV